MKNSFTKVSYGTVLFCSFFAATIQSMDGTLDIIERAAGGNAPQKVKLHSEPFPQSYVSVDNDPGFFHCQFTPKADFLVTAAGSNGGKPTFSIIDTNSRETKYCPIQESFSTEGLIGVGKLKDRHISCNNSFVLMASSGRDFSNYDAPNLFKIDVRSAAIVANFKDKVQKRLDGRLTNVRFDYEYVACNPVSSEFVTVSSFESRETLGELRSLCCLQDGSTGDIKASWEAGNETIDNLSYSPDGRYFVTSTKEGTKFWNNDGRVQYEISGPSKHIAWHPNGSCVALCQSYQGKGVIIDTETWKSIKQFGDGESQFVSGCFFNESGERFVSLVDSHFNDPSTKSDTLIAVFNTKNFEMINSIVVPIANKERIVLSPDGKYLVFNDANVLNLYDLEEHKVVDKHEHEIIKDEQSIQWVPGSANQFLSSPWLGTQLLLWSIIKPQLQ